MWYSRQEVVTRPADQSQPCRLRGSRKSLRKKWRKSRKIARRTQDVRSRARGAQGRARASCACAYAYVTEHKSALRRLHASALVLRCCAKFTQSNSCSLLGCACCACCQAIYRQNSRWSNMWSKVFRWRRPREWRLCLWESLVCLCAKVWWSPFASHPISSRLSPKPALVREQLADHFLSDAGVFPHQYNVLRLGMRTDQ